MFKKKYLQICTKLDVGQRAWRKELPQSQLSETQRQRPAETFVLAATSFCVEEGRKDLK